MVYTTHLAACVGAFCCGVAVWGVGAPCGAPVVCAVRRTQQVYCATVRGVRLCYTPVAHMYL